MRFIHFTICVLSVTLVMSQVTFPNTPIQYPTGNALGSGTATNGYVVTLTAAGWAVGDAMTLTAGGSAVTVITTLISAGTTGATGVGVVAVGGNGASTGFTCAPDKAFTTLTSLTGKTPGAKSDASTNPSAANVPAACPVDLVTIYSGTPSTGTTGSSLAIATYKLVAGIPVTWVITPPASASATLCNQVSVSVPGSATLTLNAKGGTANTCETAGGAQYFAPQSTTTPYTYSFYVQSDSGSKVCFQSASQFNTVPGTCGLPSTTTKSANILAVMTAPVLLLTALLL